MTAIDRAIERIILRFEIDSHGALSASEQDDLERIIRAELADVAEVVEAARRYAHIKSSHPQVAGEAWRDLVAALDKIGGTDE